jgi:hypothetical protein
VQILVQVLARYHGGHPAFDAMPRGHHARVRKYVPETF